MRIFGFAAVCSVLFLFSAQLWAATIQVGVGGCTLHDAIRAANANASRGSCPAGSGTDTIVVPDGFVLNSNSTLETITSPMTIRTATPGGIATIVNGANRVMEINNASGAVVLQNLGLLGRLVPTLTSTGGPGLVINNSTVTLNNVTIAHNRIDSGFNRNGAGLRATDSILVMEDVYFAYNILVPDPSPLADNTLGANIYLKNTEATLNNSTLLGFDPTQGYDTSTSGADRGAGIYADNSDLIISNSTFQNHVLRTDSFDGTHLYLANGTVAEVTNSTFFHGFVDSGSAVHVQDSELNLNNVTLFADVTEYGIVSVGGLVGAKNSLFLGYDFLHFCRAEDGDGNPIAFNLTENVANMFPPNGFCGVPLHVSDRIAVEEPADNGGPTKTARLRPLGNQAVNSGDNATCEPLDQRGVSRGGDCDIGAYELSDVTDLGVTMNLSTPAPYYSTQIIEYEVIVNNYGPSDAYEVDLSFNLSGSSVDHYVTGQNCAGLSCSIDAIPTGGSVLIRLFVAKNGAASFDASATVNNITGYSTDPNVANNIDNTGNGGSLSPAADLKVTQTLTTPPPYAIGQTLTFSILIENQGVNAANPVTLTNALIGLTNGSYTVGCDSSTATTCNIININALASRTITYTAKISGSPVSNKAEVSSSAFDPRLIDNSSEIRIATEDDAELKVSMSMLTAPPYYPFQNVQFGVIVGNSGPDTATNVRVASLAENLAITDATNPCTTLPCEITSIPSGSTVEFTMGGFFLAPGPFSHSLDVYADQTDIERDNNTASVAGTVLPSADLDITMVSPGPGPFAVGTVLDFEITVKNNGTITATGVKILEQLTNLEIVYVSSLNCTEIPCLLPVLEVGNNNRETIQVSARITAPGTFRLIASVVGEQFDFAEANDNASASGTAYEVVDEVSFRDGFEQ
jgi:uncharacterized repeat protein (TIGR01451 family)